ncbi:MAG: DEAD/DEAH box helicase [Bryobacterales bacterium]|nr:DEAD/DEAH box helicase [Bryobacterales bacterium]
MPEAAFADVDAGRILLRTPFSNLVLCKRIPGGAWDARCRMWAYPATPAHARLIRSSIPQLQFGDGFAALLNSKLADKAPVKPAAAPPASAETAVELPTGLKTRPWRHQIAAFQFTMERLLRGAGAALLALEMGVGKTLVALMVLAALAAKRILICCPLRVVPVWELQIERHLDLPLIVVTLDDNAGSVANKKKLAEEKLRLAETTGRPLVVIINYDSVWRSPFADWAEAQQWDLIIADESHRLKAPGGKASLAFKRLRPRARARLALTGTPMPHSPLDVYAQFRFLNQTIFGPSFAAFRQKYAVMGGFQRKQVTGFQCLDELEALMRTITYRVSKDVLDLPPETHVTYECDLSREALRVYRDLEEDFVAEVRDGRVTASNAMVKLLRLQQVAGGWVKTDDGQYHRVDSAKQKLLADTLEDIGPEEPVVVFCRFHADMDAVHEAAKSAGFTSLELSGRRDELKPWQDGGAQVLAVQISAGGVGVDLTRASYSIYFSLSFSLGEYDQALSRVHRPGQTRPVEHIHLVARNTVDVKIMRALEKRAEVVTAILAEIQGGAETKN